MQKDENPKKELKRNGRDKKNATEMKHSFDGHINRLDMTEEIITNGFH